ncbi:hypothetical protein ACFY2K_26360 [Kitasatospora sp. NPDC001309]|uniref:hypothetical protein n=1 Tax=Kitasatospora sp. NPDC001309 TaxID=3364013 RepID=UPI0036A44C09
MTVNISAEIRAAVEAARNPRGRARKLSDDQIRIIQQLSAENESNVTIGKVFEISPGTVAEYLKVELDEAQENGAA